MAGSPVAVNYIPAGGDFVETGDIGGSRFGFWTPRAFNPSGQVGATTTTTLSVLSVPPTYSTLGGGSGYATMGSAAAASGSPWSFGASPLPWVLAALIIGLLAFHKLYFERR